MQSIKKKFSLLYIIWIIVLIIVTNLAIFGNDKRKIGKEKLIKVS